jgi:hypothetical protein
VPWQTLIGLSRLLLHDVITEADAVDGAIVTMLQSYWSASQAARQSLLDGFGRDFLQHHMDFFR